MNVTELRPGLWRWTATHPEWVAGDGWAPEVGCVYVESEDAVVLIDPLVPDEEADDLGVSRPFRAGDRLPGGIEGFPAERQAGEVVLWLPEQRALVSGDALLGSAEGLTLCPWFSSADDRERTRQALLPLLDLPVELVLVSHGEPVLTDARSRLAEALA